VVAQQPVLPYWLISDWVRKKLNSILLWIRQHITCGYSKVQYFSLAVDVSLVNVQGIVFFSQVIEICFRWLSMFLQRSRFPLVIFSFSDTLAHWVAENGILKRTYLWGLVSYNDIHGQMYNANIYTPYAFLLRVEIDLWFLFVIYKFSFLKHTI